MLNPPLSRHAGVFLPPHTFRPKHQEYGHVASVFCGTWAATMITGYLQTAMPALAAPTADPGPYRDSWQASDPKAMAAPLDDAIQSGRIAHDMVHQAIALPFLMAVHQELAPHRLTDLAPRLGAQPSPPDGSVPAGWVEALFCRAVNRIAASVDAGAVDAAIDAFERCGDDAGQLQMKDADHLACAVQFLRILKVAHACGIPPEEAKECFAFATKPLCALIPYRSTHAAIRAEGCLVDPIHALRGLLVDALDLDHACDPHARRNGMAKPKHINRIRKILAATDVEQLVPSYHDPLAALGLDNKIPQSKRMDMVLAMVCALSEYTHRLIDRGKLDPAYSLYHVTTQHGQKVRVPIARNPQMHPDHPDNQVTWPNTSVRRFLTCFDRILKPMLDQYLHPVVVHYNKLREVINRAMLELTLKRVLQDDTCLAPDEAQTPDHVNEIRDMVRAHLFGFHALTPDQRAFLARTQQEGCLAGTWFDDVMALFAIGPVLVIHHEHIAPDACQREALRQAEVLSEREAQVRVGMRCLIAEADLPV